MTMTTRWLRRALVLGWIPTLVVVTGARWTDEPALAQTRTPIKVTRIYTGDDGKTHAEEYEMPLNRTNSFTEMADPIAVTNVQFRRTSPDYYIDWHTAPRKQFVITLAGESEVVIGDGTAVRLHPGHILLAEDTTGQGHISRAVGSEDRVSLFLPFVEQ